MLVETNVNPAGAPTEFVVGTTPNYYESPRFDGTYQRYTASSALLGSNWKSVERRDVEGDVNPCASDGETVLHPGPGGASHGGRIIDDPIDIQQDERSRGDRVGVHRPIMENEYDRRWVAVDQPG